MPRFVCAVETLEDRAANRALGIPGPVITHEADQMLMIACRTRPVMRPPGGEIFHGVIEQIVNDLLQPPSSPRRRRQIVGRVEFRLRRFLLRNFRLPVVHDAAQKIAPAGSLSRRAPFQVLRDARGSRTSSTSRLSRFEWRSITSKMRSSSAGRLFGILEQRLEITAQNRERCSQFVATRWRRSRGAASRSRRSSVMSRKRMTAPLTAPASSLIGSSHHLEMAFRRRSALKNNRAALRLAAIEAVRLTIARAPRRERTRAA